MSENEYEQLPVCNQCMNEICGLCGCCHVCEDMQEQQEEAE